MTITAKFKDLSNIQTTITWKNGAGKNGPFKVTQKAVKKPNKCKFETVKGKKTQDTLIVSTGKVTTGTGKAASLKGTTFSERLCVTQKTTTYLEPGSKIVI
jgi:outer membrane lipoprotein-sorting protein